MKKSSEKQSNEQPTEFEKKKQATRKWNSTIVFQIGLIVCIIVAGLAIELVKVETVKPTLVNLSNPDDLVYTLDAFVIEVDAVKVEEPVPEVAKTSTRIDKIIEVKNTTTVVESAVDTKQVVVSDSVVSRPVTTNPVVDVVPEPKVEIEKPIENPPIKASMNSVEVVPVFPGCEGISNRQESIACLTQKLHAFIGRKFDTEIASREKLKGQQRIFCSFTIDAQGKIVNIRTRAANEKLAEEAQRVLTKVPSLKPAMQGSEKVAVDFSIPIIFEVNN
jgi:protein TonB